MEYSRIFCLQILKKNEAWEIYDGEIYDAKNLNSTFTVCAVFVLSQET